MLLSELAAGDELGLGNDELNPGDALDIAATDTGNDDSNDNLDTIAATELFSDITALSIATLTGSVDASDSVLLSDKSPNLLSISFSGISGVVGDEEDDVDDADVGDNEGADSICFDQCFSLSNLELDFSFNFSPLLILFFFTEEIDDDEDDC